MKDFEDLEWIGFLIEETVNLNELREALVKKGQL